MIAARLIVVAAVVRARVRAAVPAPGRRFRWRSAERVNATRAAPQGPRMSIGAAPAVIAGSSILACAVVLANAPTPLRAVVVAWFTFLIPGGAIVPLLGLRDRVAQLTLCLAVSLALDLGVACALVYAEAWSPASGILVLAAFALVGAGHQALRAASADRRDGVSRRAVAASEERAS
jgi:hypothetical protein